MDLGIFIKDKNNISIGGFSVDVTLSENHEASARTTEFPIENGATASDHIVNIPKKVTIEGFVSNAPVIWFYVGGNDRVRSSIDALYKIRDDKTTVVLDTAVHHYENMVMTRLNIPRNQKTSDSLYFTAEFQQITKVEARTVEIPPDQLAQDVKDEGSATVDHGLVQTKSFNLDNKAGVAAGWDWLVRTVRGGK